MKSWKRLWVSVILNAVSAKLTRFSIQPVIDDEKQKQYIDLPTLERYKKVGGVRIEDDCVIHNDCIEVLSHKVPKEMAEIESLMQ